MTVTELEHSLFNISKLDDFLQVLEKITTTYNVFKHVNIFLTLYIYSRVLNNRPPFTNKRGLQHFQSSLLMCPFLLISPLNMLFLKKVTENVHENQEATF